MIEEELLNPNFDSRTLDPALRMANLELKLFNYAQYFVYKLSTFYNKGSESESALNKEDLSNFTQVHYFEKEGDLKVEQVDGNKYSVFP
mmetsp:Transcript_19488/g.33123  ORF Transcript_19488/g.33123 Transcript_19488/m.33123 type:complete len:89 (+) Transcript_19488:594-860(+)